MSKVTLRRRKRRQKVKPSNENEVKKSIFSRKNVVRLLYFSIISSIILFATSYEKNKREKISKSQHIKNAFYSIAVVFLFYVFIIGILLIPDIAKNDIRVRYRQSDGWYPMLMVSLGGLIYKLLKLLYRF